MPAQPTSAKAATRAAMTAELLHAHAGRPGRGGHRPGLGLLRSRHHPLGARRDRVRHRADRPHRPGHGRPGPAAQLLLHPGRRGGADHPRHRSPAPPARCGTCRSPRPAPPGRSSTGSTSSPGTDPAASPPGAPRCACSAWSSRPMREYLHTLYQFTDRWVVDDSQFRAAFGDAATPLDDALAATLAWYRDAAGPRAAQPPDHTPTREGTSPMNDLRRPARLGRRLQMAWPPLLAIAGFTALGSVFDYPPILKPSRPPTSSPSTASTNRRHRLVPRPRDQRRPAGPGRHLARPDRRRDPRQVDRRHRHRRRHRPGHRPLPLGAARPRRQRRRHRPCSHRRRIPHASSCCTPGSAPSSARPSGTPSRPPSPSWSSSRSPERLAAPLDGLPRLRLGGPDRHRRRHPARRGRRPA